MASELRSPLVGLVRNQEPRFEVPDPPDLINKVRQLPRLASLAQGTAFDVARGFEDLERELEAEASGCPHCAGHPAPEVLSSRVEDAIRRLDEFAGELKQILGALGTELDRRRRSASAAGSARRDADLKTRVDAYERRLILSALEAAGMKQTAAASLLGVGTTTLNEKIKRLGLRGRRARS